jgi:hypothetical protein
MAQINLHRGNLDAFLGNENAHAAGAGGGVAVIEFQGAVSCS